MKKYLVGILLASMLVVVPFVSSALSPVINAPLVVKDKAVVAQVYESGIQKLKTTYQLRITNPHSNSLYITQSYSPFSLSFVNETRPNVYGDVRSCRVVSYTTSAGVPLARDDKGTAYLVLEPGKTIKYTVVKTCNTNELLSGTYKSRLNTIQYANTLSPVSFMGVDLSHISSDNSVYVVGEKSPWLERLVVLEGSSEGWVELYGERLSSAYVNKIYLGDRFVDVTSNPSSTMISFDYRTLDPNLVYAYVYVSGPNGYSNRLVIEPWPACGAAQGVPSVTKPDTNLCRVGNAYDVHVGPGSVNWIWTCAFNGPNDINVMGCYAPIVTPQSAITINLTASTLRTFPGGWLKFRGENLTTNVAGFNYSVIGARLSDGNKRLDFKVDPREPIGAKRARLLGPGGAISNDATVEIFSKPTTTSAVQFNQIANILSALWSVLEQLKTQ